MTIPKKLFQTAKAYDILPGEIKDNIRSLRDLNPDWDYSFLTTPQSRPIWKHTSVLRTGRRSNW